MWAIKQIKILLMSDHKAVLSDHKIFIFSKYFQWAIATLLLTSTTIVYSKEKYKVFTILWEIVLMSDHTHHVSDQTGQIAYEGSQECFERSQDIDFFQIFLVSNSHPFTHIHHHFIQQGEIQSIYDIVRNSPYEWSHTSCERSNRSKFCLWVITKFFWAITPHSFFRNISMSNSPPFTHPPPLYVARRNIKHLQYCEK